MYKLNAYGKEWDLTLVRSHYNYGGGLAVMANIPEGECFAVLTVNISDRVLSNMSAFVDTNNCPWAEKFLIENNIAIPTGITETSGFCIYPLYIFNLTKLQEEL